MSDPVSRITTVTSGASATVQGNLDTHEADIANPHTVTKAQVGLGNVDNTSDANAPVSTAQAAADAVVLAAAVQRANHTGTQTLATISDAGTAAASATGDFTPIAHATDTANPHTVTKAQVGLGNVDNTSDANAPVSTAQAAADAVVLAAAILRANHTGTQTLATISDAGTAAASATGDFTPIAHATDTANPHTVTKAQVGLGNVDNTSDANAPVSTAQQTALDLKADGVSDTTITVERGSTDVLSAAALRTAYTAAKALTPGGNALSATNRAVVMIPAGRYDFGLGDVGDSNHGLELDAQFVDLVGATGVREEVILTSAIAVASRGTVEQTA